MATVDPKDRPHRPRPHKPKPPTPKGVTDTKPNQGGNKDDKGKDQHYPPGFLKKLADAGLRVNNNGKIVGIGPGETASSEQLKLMQSAYDRFGLTNQLYDPTRVYATGETTKTFAGKTPVFYSLSTGRATSGSGLLSDEDLAAYREAAGYDPMAELNAINQGYIDLYGEEQGAALAMTPEEFDIYNRRARINYQHEGDLQGYYQGLHDEGIGSTVSENALAGMTQGAGDNRGLSYVGGFDVAGGGGGGGGRAGGRLAYDALNEEDYAALGGVVGDFLHARQQKLIAQQAYNSPFPLESFQETE